MNAAAVAFDSVLAGLAALFAAVALYFFLAVMVLGALAFAVSAVWLVFKTGELLVHLLSPRRDGAHRRHKLWWTSQD